MVEREIVVEAEKKRVEDHAPIRIEAPVREIPKSERVIKEKQAPLFHDLPDTPLPPLALLDEAPPDPELVSAETLEFTSRLIEKKLKDFGVEVKVLAAYPGPVITRYEIEPAVGVKGSQVVNLVKDLARALSVVSIRVVETIPGKSCMGLEIPNPRRQTVRLTEILGSKAYHDLHSPLTLALGKDIGGHPVVADLARMPHLLVAGTTGSGKSVALNAMILSLLYKAEPRDVRIVMVDPKMLELSVYQDIPHLLAPVVTDMKQAASALMWCIGEMERRYKLMSWLGVRNLSGFNHKVAEAEKRGEKLEDPNTVATGNPVPLQRLPHIVVVIDELADLMMVVGKKVEELIARLAQKARAAGIHLLVATQRPSVDVITGLIKANIPTRIAFQVSSKVDSRTILDQHGAETLLGQGDMLYLPPGSRDSAARARRVRRRPGGAQGRRVPQAAGRAGLRRGPARGRRGRWRGRFPAGRGRRRVRHALRPGGGDRDAHAPAVDLARAAAPAHRLQPGGAPHRADGAGGARVVDADERQPRGARPEPGGVAMRFAPAVAAAVGLFSLLATGLAHASGIERLNQFMASTVTATGEFEQRVANRDRKLVQESRGTFAFARPGRFRWTYAKPYPQVIVGDGARVWVYDEDLNQVTVRRLGQALGATPAALLAGSNEALNAFELKDEGTREGLEWVQAIPRDKDSGFERIRMGFGFSGIERMELVDAFGQTTELRFSGLRRNPRVDPALFSFSPPKGADVVGDK